LHCPLMVLVHGEFSMFVIVIHKSATNIGIQFQYKTRL
jgi:hypothetical protein